MAKNNSLQTILSYPRRAGEIIKIVITDHGVTVQKSIELDFTKIIPLDQKVKEQKKAFKAKTNAYVRINKIDRKAEFIEYLQSLEIDATKGVIITSSQFGYMPASMTVMVSQLFNKAGLGYIKCSVSKFVENSLTVTRIK